MTYIIPQAALDAGLLAFLNTGRENSDVFLSLNDAKNDDSFEDAEDFKILSEAFLESVKIFIAAYEAAQWQPIETCPKNTHIIDLYDKNERERHCAYRVFINEDGESLAISPNSITYDLSFFSHWRPLPQPPKEA